jgi:alpha-tubulin suppressor-like RCC1 family protein
MPLSLRRIKMHKLFFILTLLAFVYAKDAWKISSTPHNTLLLKKDSTLWSWGDKQIAPLDSSRKIYSGKVTLLSNKKFIAISAGRVSYAISKDSTLWEWKEGDFFKRRQISSDKFISVSHRYFGHTLALKADSTLWGWGKNSYGELGDVAEKKCSIPIQITNLKFLKVSAGDYFSLALAADSTLWSWGENNRHQLGRGPKKIKTSDKKKFYKPAQVSKQKFIEIDAGKTTALAIAKDGTLWSWGDNGNSQAGGGKKNVLYKPQRISKHKFKAIATNEVNSFAIAKDGRLWGFGRNYWSGLGAGDYKQRFKPTRIGKKKILSHFYQ